MARRRANTRRRPSRRWRSKKDLLLSINRCKKWFSCLVLIWEGGWKGECKDISFTVGSLCRWKLALFYNNSNFMKETIINPLVKGVYTYKKCIPYKYCRWYGPCTHWVYLLCSELLHLHFHWILEGKVCLDTHFNRWAYSLKRPYSTLSRSPQKYNLSAKIWRKLLQNCKVNHEWCQVFWMVRVGRLI